LEQEERIKLIQKLFIIKCNKLLRQKKITVNKYLAIKEKVYFKKIIIRIKIYKKIYLFKDTQESIF